MAITKLKGDEVVTSGNLPEVGVAAPNFELIAGDLSRKTLENYKGQRLILNIFPSVDTSTCATSVRTFNQKAAQLDNTKVLCISRDLPFAQKRFCGAEGIENVEMLSDYAKGSFGQDYGLEIENGALYALHARAIVVVDENGIVQHTELVPDIVDEPNYEAALNA
ncbi:thiol peroxidase (atypical 2-Cys peroxiredoxin) [Lishizhenia tianjinensis]|uniref:Thiol peroxidase n=1 Tax=Lishizhenia tianjinensis TaxID=477690 RepID=A0A1I6XU69_9FLAO|nr:thiol peroxidase [Lishizhenia tianjinensis]SFT41637.1 thiol peroxidase (atypical 2-Cys peroxiredoxin) [Lishizhenia tianjinensis]